MMTLVLGMLCVKESINYHKRQSRTYDPLTHAKDIRVIVFPRHTRGEAISAVMDFIREAVKRCHVELTTLIIPGENDLEEEMRQISTWISELKDANGNTIGRNIPLHISRFFPCFHMTDRDATDVSKVYRLADIAREKLKYVYTGNC